MNQLTRCIPVETNTRKGFLTCVTCSPVKHRTGGRLKRSCYIAAPSINGSAYSRLSWTDWTRWSSLVASERMRPRFAPGSTMGWDSLESNSKKSEWVKWVEFMRPQGF